MLHPIALMVGRIHAGPWLASCGMVAIAAATCFLLRTIVLPPNLALVFLTAVLFSALRYGLWPSIFSSLLSELIWNFFFVPPRFTFYIDDPQDLLALVLFLIVSLVVSNLVAQQKRQGEAIRAQADASRHLYQFSQQIGAIGSLDALLEVICRTIGGMLGCGATIVLEDHDGKARYAAFPTVEIGPEQLAAALTQISGDRWDDGNWSAGTEAQTGASHYGLRLRSLSRGAGAIAITRPPASLSADERLSLTMLTEQAAVAIERLELARSVEQSNLRAELERLRSAMLTSLSHDLRTPLTVIMATHSALRSLDYAADPETRRDLLDRAQAEAERLNLFIGNLLDMTKLESGKLNMKLGPIDVIDAVESAVGRAAPLIAQHRLEIDLPADLPMATADFMLLEQVVFNLLDNAAKYAPAQSPIRISGKSSAGLVTIEVADQGPGIPPDLCESIFDKFTRLRQEDRQLPGTGLGLAICRGFLSAMGGVISAHNRTGGSGAVFTVSLGVADIPAEAQL